MYNRRNGKRAQVYIPGKYDIVFMDILTTLKNIHRINVNVD
jgi:hypothetical protein